MILQSMSVLMSLNIDDQHFLCAILTDLTEQKKYDRALAEEKFSRMILEQTGEAVIVCDPSWAESSAAVVRPIDSSGKPHSTPGFMKNSNLCPPLIGMSDCGGECHRTEGQEC